MMNGSGCGENEEIKMEHQESSLSCPLLIDLNESMSTAPIPEKLESAAEYDDTFGLFQPQPVGNPLPKNLSFIAPPPLIPPPLMNLLEEGGPDGSLNSTSSSPFGLGLGMRKPKTSRNKKGLILTPVGRVARDHRAVDPFSPIFTTETYSNDVTKVKQDPPTGELVVCDDNKISTTPVKRRSVGLNLSDSDSLLDIDNLSAFSCSADSDGLLEQIIDTAAIENAQDNHSDNNTTTTTPVASSSSNGPCFPTPPSNSTISSLEEDMTSKCLDKDGNKKNFGEPALEEEFVVREKKRRDSVNSKLQQLSMLISSPIANQYSPDGNPTSKYIPTPMTTPSSRRTLSFHSCPPKSTVSTMTSPSRAGAPIVPSVQSAARIPMSPSSSCTRYFGVGGKLNKAGSSADDDELINSVKRLSFATATSESSSPSPSKSVKRGPTFDNRRNSNSLKSCAVVTPQPGTSKPLKASVKPLLPLVEVDMDKMSSSGTMQGERLNRSGCASAPVRRKFLPPVAQSSPILQPRPRTSSSSTSNNSNSGGTPLRRTSYSGVRSSGYGVQTPASESSTAPPLKKIIPSSPKTTISSSRYGGKQVMGIRGQVPTPALNNSIGGGRHEIQAKQNNQVITKRLSTTGPNQSVTNASNAISSSATNTSKENRPKMLASALPRFGFGYKKK